MNNVSQRLRIIDAVGVAAILAVAAAVYLGGIGPILWQHQQRKVQRQELATQREQADDLQNQLNQLRTQLRRAETAAADHSLRLEPLSALNARVARLTDFANTTGLTVQQVRLGEVVAGTHYHTVPIELSGEGRYSDSSQFLDLVHETMPDVATASVSLRSRPGDEGDLAFVLHLLWYAAAPNGASDG